MRVTKHDDKCFISRDKASLPARESTYSQMPSNKTGVEIEVINKTIKTPLFEEIEKGFKVKISIDKGQSFLQLLKSFIYSIKRVFNMTLTAQ